MKNKVDVQSDIMFEHRFWLQILGDHARFIHQSLAPKETREISLPPTFLNHMVNELEEYERILNDVLSGSETPTFHAVHYHLLWLSDAAGHAATISSLLDMVEHDYKQKSHHFTKQFEHFYLKAVELAGYLRTHLQSFPALSRFHHQAEMEIQLFQSFLHELTEMRLRDEVLGVLSPLMADHMSREECYYLLKLSEVSDVKMPDCYPTRPRIEQ